jgi:hypothetical protein
VAALTVAMLFSVQGMCALVKRSQDRRKTADLFSFRRHAFLCVPGGTGCMAASFERPSILYWQGVMEDVNARQIIF